MKGKVFRPERALIVGVVFANEVFEKEKESLSELSELVRSAGGVVAHEVIQHLKSANPALLIGHGKASEIAKTVKEEDIDLVVFNEELSPSQVRNLEEIIEKKIIDRTALILDIFAQRAKTKEGKLQVELAQLNYRLTRLTGKGIELSRLGGGIGTRGPGETQLEVDKRRIKEKILRIRKELEKVRNSRALHREKRKSVPVPVAAIVGYTNAGKSTLLNALVSSDIPAEDKLFATLDPTTKRLILPNKQKVLLTDTVGFIKKLPHQLVESFKATLEEVLEADILIHVVDYSKENHGEDMDAVFNVLNEIGAAEKPVITFFNKCDKISYILHRTIKSKKIVYGSAIQKQGLNELLLIVEETLKDFFTTITVKVPEGDWKAISEIYENGKIIGQSTKKGYLTITALVSKRFGETFSRKKSAENIY